MRGRGAAARQGARLSLAQTPLRLGLRRSLLLLLLLVVVVVHVGFICRKWTNGVSAF